jgi:excisionase family DNA binding protein
MLRHEKETALQASAAAQVKVQPRFLKVPAAVAYSGINRTVLYELISSGKIKSHLIGASRVIDRESIDQYVSSQPGEAVNPRIRGRGGRRALESVPS